MKKLSLVLVFVLLLALALAGCGEEKKVTIYIPDSIIYCDASGTTQYEINYIFEEGWETKESFTVTYGGDVDKLGSTVPTLTYNGKTVVSEQDNGRTESTCDDNGRQISHAVYYTAENTSMEKVETVFTYDQYGRRLSQETRSYAPGSAAPVNEEIRTFTYTDTETGSKGTSSQGSATYVLEYDKDYRRVAQITIMNDQELTRTETSYDQHGNTISVISYINGQKASETKYTYKAVEVSAETAARLPQFKQGK